MHGGSAMDKVKHDGVVKADLFDSLEQGPPEDFEALRCLIESERMLRRAQLQNIIDLYREAFYLAERVVLYYPESTVLKSSVAYFILGLTRLKDWNDQNYAMEKYQALLESQREIDQKLARILKREIDQAISSAPPQ
jgi:hypothetical protein